MHFPTSLPPTSGSPAAKLNLECGHSPHPETFDGPLPPLPRSKSSQIKLPLRSKPRGPRPSPPGYLPPPIPPRPTPRRGVLRYDIPKFPLPNLYTGPEVIPSPLTTAKMKMKGDLSTKRLLEARNSWKRKRKARLDGARKPDSIGNSRNSEYGGDAPGFEKTQEDPEKRGTLILMNPKYKLKKIFGVGHEEIEKPMTEHSQRVIPRPRKPLTMDQPQRSLPSVARNSRRHLGKTHSRMTLTGPRERLMAARASREEDREDFGEDSDLDEPSHILGSERRRMSRQMKKLSINEFQDRYEAHRERRRSEKEAELLRAQQFSREAHREQHGFSGAAKRKVMMAKEELQAYRSTRREERGDAEEKTGTRIFSAVRAARARFEDRDAEREAKRQADMRSKPSTIRPSEWPSEQIQFLPTSRRVPIFSSPTYNQNNPSSPTFKKKSISYSEADDSQSPKALGSSSLYNASPAPTERTRAYQQVFPTRPPSSYRPSLSPVYSKSPIPTNSLSQVTSTSLNPPKVTLNNSIDTKNKMVPASTILDLFQPASGPSPHRIIETTGQEIPRKSSPSSTTTITGEGALQSTDGVTSSRNRFLYRHPQQSFIAEDEIPPLKLPSPEVRPVNMKGDPFQEPPNPKRTPLRTQVALQSQKPEINFEKSTDPKGTYKNIDLTKTPTSSALEFWAAADASLAPSESASAQPGNRRGELPPDIWKDADRTLNLRKGGPTMEDWIASLPGLGLRLGPWAADRNLDSKMLEDLRMKSPESSKIHGDELWRAELAERLKEIDDRALKQTEELIPEDEVELTLEVKPLEPLEYELVPGNTPPTVIDLSLLHPDYIPTQSSVTSALTSCKPHQLSTVQEFDEEKFLPYTRARLPTESTNEQYNLMDHPQPQLERPSDLAGDVMLRLDALEKYWDKQGIVMGTVLKRMLWIVDTMIVNEREDMQRLVRRKEMGWMEDEGGDYEEQES